METGLMRRTWWLMTIQVSVLIFLVESDFLWFFLISGGVPVQPEEATELEQELQTEENFQDNVPYHESGGVSVPAEFGDQIEMADLTSMDEKNEELPRFGEKEICENRHAMLTPVPCVIPGTADMS